MTQATLRHQVTRIIGQRKLRTILVVPFVLQIFGAVGLVGYISYRNGQLAIEDLATQRMQEVDNRIAERLEAYLDAPHQVNQLNQAALDLGQLNIQVLSQMERHFWQQSQVFNRVSYIQYGSAQGEFVGLAVNDDGSFTYQVTEETGDLRTYEIDRQGRRGSRTETSLNFDPRNRPWYTVPEAADQPAWTDIYAWVNPPTLAITLGQPYYRNGQFQGILATDLTIAQISDFLKTLELSQTGRLFILERSGQMVATSGQEKPFSLKRGQPERLNALQSEDELTRTTTEFLRQRFGDLSAITDRQDLTLKIANTKHFVHIHPVRDQHGLNWLSVIVVPESAFMAQTIANTRITIILSAAALAIATLVGLLRSQWVVRPILQLNEAAQKLAAGDFEQTVNLNREDELGTLARSFNHMAMELRISFQEQQVMFDSLSENERQLAEYNQTLEQQVQQRTQDLVQAEKMAALGQLTAGIAHEINTPLGAIRAAENNITAALDQTLQQLPVLVRALSDEQLDAFLHLLDTAHRQTVMLSSREERQLKRRLQKEINALGLAPAAPIASTLSKMGIQTDLTPFLTLLKAPNNTQILDVAYSLFIIHNNSSNINLAVERAAKIVFALKSYVRQDTTKAKVKASVPDTVETVLTLYHNQIKQGTDVQKHYQPVPEIYCYPEELAQVWTNLIHNALQAMDYKGHLEINIAQQDQHIVVSISDSGNGIPAEIKAKIFDPFFTTKPMGEGSGLGLDIVLKIVNKHQGSVEVESEHGHTKFSIYLPVMLTA